MSSFLMSYPHAQGAMGTGYEPKFPPPSESDFHLHHHSYGMNGITASNHMDYNGYYNYNYGTPPPNSSFAQFHPAHSINHQHHPPYGSPQMHHPANAPSPNFTPQPNLNLNSNLSNNNTVVSVGNRNNSVAPNLVNGISESSASVENIGYYNGYYTNTNGHLPPDSMPICPSAEPPANTALGLQELGNFIEIKELIVLHETGNCDDHLNEMEIYSTAK